MARKVILTPDQIKRLVRARQSGAQFDDLGRRFGISSSSAEGYYRKATKRPEPAQAALPVESTNA